MCFDPPSEAFGATLFEFYRILRGPPAFARGWKARKTWMPGISRGVPGHDL